MKHLKLFNDSASYDTWKNSEDYVTPNVSYVVEGNFVDYNAYVIEKLIMQVGNKYPDVVTRLAAIANKYAPSAINNFINELFNAPETPEHVKSWDTESYVDDVRIKCNELSDINEYIITFKVCVSIFDPSYDWSNPDWDDPTINEKYFDFSDEKSLILSSEDCDFIKSLGVYDSISNIERPLVSFLDIYNNDYDENGNWVPNQGTLNNISSVIFSMYNENNWGGRNYRLDSDYNYELFEIMSPS
jgi:hypothetical protein